MPHRTTPPSRPLCYVRRGGSVMETCTRTIHGLPLLRPGREPNERMLGVLGRATEYYDVDVYGFGFASSHVHLLHGAEHGLQMSRFQGHFNGNVAREIGRLHDHREKLWGRRYRPMAPPEVPPTSQVACFQ